MKRIKVNLEQVAERKNLVLALHKASSAKRHRVEVSQFINDADNRLNCLSTDILAECLPYGRYRSFQIHDPKKRLIHAACFEDRVFHHALMNIAGGVLERAMSPMSYACRPNMGVHRAIAVVQKNIQRYQWYCQIDIEGYFAAINHDILLETLLTRFKGQEIEDQLSRILQTYKVKEGKGLPIGSLTSQYFANYYLDALDRLLAKMPLVRAHIRYMDDIVWWCDDKASAKQLLSEVSVFLQEQRALQIKPSWRLQRSQQGITFCGFRVLSGIIRMSRRRKRRYKQRRLYWERLYRKGLISGTELQTAYAAVFAITFGTNSLEWRKQNLRNYPALMI